MTWTAIVILLLIGILLITLEIVALPGAIAGIVGVIMLSIGVWQSYATYGIVAGNIVLIVSVVVCILLLVFFMRSKTWRFFGLKTEIDSKVNTVDEDLLAVGARGRTVSRLAPTGKANINGQIVEVHTVSEFVNENEEVEITKIEGYKITVKRVVE
jgi:membrane-bound ClpP family serine protease